MKTVINTESSNRFGFKFVKGVVEKSYRAWAIIRNANSKNAESKQERRCRRVLANRRLCLVMVLLMLSAALAGCDPDSNGIEAQKFDDVCNNFAEDGYRRIIKVR